MTAGKVVPEARAWKYRWGRAIEWQSDELTTGKPCLVIAIGGQKAVLQKAEVLSLLLGCAEFLVEVESKATN
jgi:hypothetical protein